MRKQTKYFIYILLSLKDNNIYIGMTNNLTRRIKEHNKEYNKSTKSRAPFVLIHYEKFNNRIEARQKEKWFKSGIGREFIKNVILRRGVEQSGSSSGS